MVLGHAREPQDANPRYYLMKQWSSSGSALAALVGMALPFYVVSLARSGGWDMGAIGPALITMTLGVIVGVPSAIAPALQCTGRSHVTATVVFVTPYWRCSQV